MAGVIGKRITMTIPFARYETLKVVAAATNMTPVAMAKEMVFAGLDMMAEVVEIAEEDGMTEDRALRKMWRVSLERMAKGIDV